MNLNIQYIDNHNHEVFLPWCKLMELKILKLSKITKNKKCSKRWKRENKKIEEEIRFNSWSFQGRDVFGFVKKCAIHIFRDGFVRAQ